MNEMRALRNLLFLGCSLGPVCSAATLSGEIRDADTDKPVAARLYVKGADGSLHHASSRGGTAVPYKVVRGESVEIHTTLSADPFKITLPPGRYTLTAERGKEFHPAEQVVEIVDEKPLAVTLKLKRWTGTPLASSGWYSGDTHVHRKMAELPTLLLAEDLNVGLPLTSWVTDSRQVPKGDASAPAKLVRVDDTHVIWPVNTEYEIFTVNGKPHTLGAVFALNHKEPFKLTAPPVGPIAKEARRQGALLDLDKHNWPWSMMLVPTMGVDLYELTNNHLWRSKFYFNKWQREYTPDHWKIERDGEGYTERGWIEFGFRNYYALLNSGFRMQPSAGTASGVHPVPLGFGRVYVKVDGEFTYEKWIEGLAAGNSFVTTGPILDVKVSKLDENHVTVAISYASRFPDAGIQVIVNGKPGISLDGSSWTTDRKAHRTRVSGQFELKTTSWVAVRAFEDRPDGRPRFAHSAPVWFEVPGKPLVPDAADVGYLVKRVEDELKRHEGVLPEEALQEYRDAAKAFRKSLEKR